MESDLGKLFIGGISWDTNEARLREYFGAYGEVVEAVIMKDRTTGRARGFGFIVFADPSVAERVVMEKHIIDGRTVEAKKAVPRDDQHILNRHNSSIHGSPGLSRTKKIFVGGLASTVTENDFKKYFDQFGNITDVVVMYDHNTQRPRGFGFITYDSEEAVEKVLLKTYHELNGKLVEVKRAVPKELSPAPNRSPLAGYGYGFSRINNFLNGYMPGYNPSSISGYGMRMGSRFGPVSSARGGYGPFGPPAYGMGLNFEPGLNPVYGGGTNFGSNLGYGRGLNMYYNGNSNRYADAISYAGASIGSGSILSPTGRSVWGTGGLGYSSSSTNASSFVGSGTSPIGSLGSMGLNWGLPTSLSGQAGLNSSGFTSENLRYGSGDGSFAGLSGNTYVGNSGAVVTSSSFSPSNRGYDGSYVDLPTESSVYGDSTWHSARSELDGHDPFGYGFDNTANISSAKNSSSYIGNYSAATNQPNRRVVA